MLQQSRTKGSNLPSAAICTHDRFREKATLWVAKGKVGAQRVLPMVDNQ